MTVRCAELHRLGRLSFTLPSPWQVSLGNGENRTFDRRCLGTRNALKILILLSHATKVGSAQAHTWNSCTSRHRQAHTYRHSFLQALTRTRADVSCIPASSRSVYEVHYVRNGRQDLRCDPNFENACGSGLRQAHCSHATQTGASFSAKPRTCSLQIDGQGEIAATA